MAAVGALALVLALAVPVTPALTVAVLASALFATGGRYPGFAFGRFLSAAKCIFMHFCCIFCIFMHLFCIFCDRFAPLPVEKVSKFTPNDRGRPRVCKIFQVQPWYIPPKLTPNTDCIFMQSVKTEIMENTMCYNGIMNTYNTLPLKPCKHVGCPNLVSGGGYCDKHKPAPAPDQRSDEARNWHKLYSTKWWRQTRALQLIIEPFCRECAAKGVRTRATDVDHIKPHKGYRKLFYDKSNLQSLCHECHSRKTARELSEGAKR